MIRLSRLGVWRGSATMTSDQQAARHEAIVTTGLPGIVPVLGGLLRFDKERATLARKAASLGRHFFPLEEVEHGMRFAHHALDCIIQSYCRLQEARQQTQDGWTLEEESADGDPNEERFFQKVIPKVPRRKDLAEVPRVKLTIRATSVEEALDLCELEMRRCARDAFPITSAAPDIGWKLKPDRYLFAHRGSPLTKKDLGLLLRYLLAGWPPYRFHDFRHVMAEDAKRDGESGIAIQVSLGHADDDQSKLYSELPWWMEADVASKSRKRRSEAVDDRRARGDATARQS